MMTMPKDSLVARIEARFGAGRAWTPTSGFPAMVWETRAYHLLCPDGSLSETELRRLWEARMGRQAHPVVLLAASDEPDKVWVAGPQSARPMRKLPADQVFDMLEACRSQQMRAREAASVLSREFIRLEESVVPGLRVKDLLTPHFVRERLRRSMDERGLSEASAHVGRAASWRPLFESLGYAVEQLPRRGYLLRRSNAPIAVVHPLQAPSMFSRLSESGELPEGLALADCERHGASWGILAAGSRMRLFQSRPPIGAATGQYIEIDLSELQSRDRLYVGLFAPESLGDGGWLSKWIGEARDFGEELRKGLEDRLITDALPNIARGLGEYFEGKGVDLSGREQLREIEEAALTLVFRFMFLLHTEARGYLPVGSAAYRPYSALKLADDCRRDMRRLDSGSTLKWDSLWALVRLVRSGDSAVGVPAYNGSLFAASGFPGSSLLEKAEIADTHLGPALVAIAYPKDTQDAPGLDYAGLDIGHLGAIYEKLLSYRLTRAAEDLAYDAKQDIFRPMRAGERRVEVTRADLYYQAEAGGRQAAGVFYTRREFVKHLLIHSLKPALEGHLARIEALAKRNPDEAAQRLFDFSVVDPAMGSAHFLTAALDMMTDRIEIFLADIAGLPAIALQLDELREGGDTMGLVLEDGDLLRRLILKRCIYGVDLSPMAVEVANVTLWLASFVPGLALSYLGSNLKCGDALIGVADTSVVDKSFGKANTNPLLTGPVRDAMERAAGLQRELAQNPDRTPEEVKQSEMLAKSLREETSGLRRAFDLWAAEPLGVEGARHTLETGASELVEGKDKWKQHRDIADKVEAAEGTAARYRFFHWPLEFPNIFHRDRPGFDAVVGNPPWNKVKFEIHNFLALQDPGIRGLRSALERDERAERLFQRRPELRQEIEDIKRRTEEQREFFRPENGYTIQGSGDTDLYKLFCERYAYLSRADGHLGVVLPYAAFVNFGSVGFRKWLFEQNTVLRLDAIRNARHWAFPIHAQFAIALLASKRARPAGDFTLETTGPSTSIDEFMGLSSGDVVHVHKSILSPRWEIPALQTEFHASLLEKFRAGTPFVDLEIPEIQKNLKGGGRSPRPVLVSEVHEANDRRLFRFQSGTPVWKGRSFHPYDPHGSDPAGYADWDELIASLNGRRKRSRVLNQLFSSAELDDPSTHPINHARIAYHDVTNSVDYDTVIACLIPPKIALGHSAPYIAFSGFGALHQACVLGVLNSLPFDWQARRYVKLHLSFYILNSLTFPSWEGMDWRRIGELAARLSCVDERYAGFAVEAGVECGPLSEYRRMEMRAEIDALVARGYGLTVDELWFVFTDFTERAVSPAYREMVVGRFEGVG